MPNASSFRVRFAIVGIGTTLALAFLISPGQAQPGRTPGGFSGRPAGGIAGNPGGISGMPGGISGISGRPPGSISGMPGGIHGAGITGIHGTGISGIHGAGISGMPGEMGGFGPSVRDEWRCSGCNHLVGSGPIKPLVDKCPSCGARFSNGFTPQIGGGLGMPSTPVVPPPVAGRFGAPPVTAPPVTTPPTFGAPGAAETNPPPALPTNPAFTNPAPPVAPPSSTSVPNPPTASEPSAPAPTGTESGTGSGKKGRTILVIGIVVGVILFLGMMAALAVVVSKASAAKPVKRKRRKVYDDED